MKKLVQSLQRALLSASLILLAMSAQTEVTRVSDWLGRVVLTSEGELLGRVEDLAIKDGQTIEFVVVSVGSFLVDDNLIAVAPDALIEATNEDYLTISVEALEKAPRFNEGSWPGQAQVVDRNRDSSAVELEVDDADLPPPGTSGRSGLATIVSDDRKGTITDGQLEATIEQQVKPAASPQVAGGPQPKQITEGILEQGDGGVEFRRMDSNQDRYLSRREIGANLPAEKLFADYDLDSNGGLDSFEFRVLQEDLQ